jgi:hypothetical protein
MRRAYIRQAVATLFLLLSACTWVEVNPELRKVRVVEAGEVIGCERLGVANVATVATFGLFDRYTKSIDEELAALARGSAVELGGNTLVPLTGVVDGRQRYAVYRCPR